MQRALLRRVIMVYEKSASGHSIWDFANLNWNATSIALLEQ